MPTELFTNNATTTLGGAINSSVTSLTVASSTGFPTPVAGVSVFRIIIGTELMVVTAVVGTTWTVERGAEGSVAAGHTSGDAVSHVVTAGALVWPRPLKPRINEFVNTHGLYSTTVGTLGTSGLVILAPILLPTGTYDQAIIVVKTAGTAGATVRIGMYDADEQLLADFGTVAGDSTGVKTMSISFVNPVDRWCYAAVVQQGTMTTAVSVLTRGSAGDVPFINNDMESTPGGAFGFLGAETGALPASLTAKGRSSGTSGLIPSVRFRRSA